MARVIADDGALTVVDDSEEDEGVVDDPPMPTFVLVPTFENEEAARLGEEGATSNCPLPPLFLEELGVPGEACGVERC
jgi:hypothetical protein